MCLFIPIVFGSTTFTANNISVTYRPEDVHAIDIDGDSDIDILAISNLNNYVIWYENNGREFFTEHNISYLKGVNSIYGIDLDEDGDIDVVATNDAGSTGGVRWYQNNGFESFTEKSISALTNNDRSESSFPIDLDEDGDIDVVMGTLISDEVRWYDNNGAESFTKRIINDTIEEVMTVYAVDLDEDNDIDVIWGTRDGHDIGWLKNDGSETFTKHIINDTITSAFDVYPIDLDSDDDIDIVIADTLGNEVMWLENDGSESFTLNTLYATTNPYSVYPIDLDEDDDIDVISASWTGIRWHENIGSANFITHTLYAKSGVFISKDVYAIDLDSDGDTDILASLYIDNTISWFENDLITTLACIFPSIFCDDFDYTDSMSSRNWLIQLGGGQINSTFTPIDDKLTLVNTQNIFPYHETEPFIVTYRPDSGSKFTRHYLSPVFSSEFILNFNNNTDNQFFYTAFEKQTITAYSIKAEIDSVGNSSGNMNWFYMNDTQPSVTWKKICSNCTTANTDIYIKINSLFQQRDDFPFNSSIDDDEIRLYADYALLGTIEDFLDSRTTYISQYEFGKLTDGNYTVDDYYVMVGTDRYISTFEQYFSDIYRNDSKKIIEIGDAETGDMAAALTTIWDDMGLKSYASRIMTGLFLMFLLALIMFAMALKTGHPLSAGILITVELFFMILLTFIKLLPIWLPFVVVLVAAGIGAAIFKMGTAA